jgi:hypothetical protein
LVREEDLRQIVARLVQQAQAGDLAAAELVLAWAIGPPLSGQEMTNEETDEQESH